MTAPAEKSTSTAVAKVEEKKGGVVGLMQHPRALEMITPFLRGVAYDEIINEVRIAVQKNDAILKCTPISILTAVAEAVQTGGVIGRDVYLVPFGLECQTITDYKFDAKMIVATGAARAVDAYCVYENEPFEYELGSAPRIVHHPIMDEKQRGKLIGAYATARVAGGHVKVVVMSLGEIDAIRTKHSKQWGKLKECPPWYAKKTTLRQLAKLLPTNARIAKLRAQWSRDEPQDAADDLGEPIAVVERGPVRGEIAPASESFPDLGDDVTATAQAADSDEDLLAQDRQTLEDEGELPPSDRKRRHQD